MDNKRSDAMEKQVGGQHYKKHIGLQPWDIIDEYDLNYYEGNILKYLLREKSDRIEDLGKLIHYAEKELENLGKYPDETQALDDRIEKYEDSMLYDKVHMGIEGFKFDVSYETQIRESLRTSAYYLYEYNEDDSMSIHSRSEGKHNIHFDNYDEFKAWQIKG